MTYLSLLEINVGMWKKTCFLVWKNMLVLKYNTDGWSCLGLATSMELIWWSDNSFLHANACSLS